MVGRGIDVSGISHIINYDIPTFCDDYVHRVGRTGRMGREGVAYTFVTPEEGPELTRIEMRIDRLLKRDEIEGFEAVSQPQLTVPAEPTAAQQTSGEDPEQAGQAGSAQVGARRPPATPYSPGSEQAGHGAVRGP